MSFFSQSPLNINISNLNFHGVSPKTPLNTAAKDGFVSNPLYNIFDDKARIELEANNNPKIKELMNKYNLPLKVNAEELERLHQGHMKNTRINAVQIYSNLPPYLKKDVNLKSLQEAAILHDYGKTLIPDNILNKKGDLSEKEREIMNLHSVLGYELLKNRGLDDNTLRLIKYHHQNPQRNGYPAVSESYEHGIDAQILNAADEYTALREERSYKKALSREEALAIIHEQVDAGLIMPEIYAALERAV